MVDLGKQLLEDHRSHDHGNEWARYAVGVKLETYVQFAPELIAVAVSTDNEAVTWGTVQEQAPEFFALYREIQELRNQEAEFLNDYGRATRLSFVPAM